MSGIAEKGDGSFYFIERVNTVDEAFLDSLGGLTSSIARNITI